MNVNPTTPITAVKVLRGVPFDSTYTDTINFANAAAQTSFFTGKAKYTFTNLSPVRMQNVLRLPVPADNIYDCNYIMFQNANFNQKWFYAFITKIDFINMNMCHVTIELDVIQTWWFDITIRPCYVLREHSVTDAIGDNMVAEDVDLGEYVYEEAETTPFFDAYTAVIAAAYNPPEIPGGTIGGLFSGVTYIGGSIESSSGVQRLLEFLQKMAEEAQIDSIAATFIMPSDFYTEGKAPVFKTFNATKQQTDIGGYVPKNKKLLTYPYNMLMVTSSDGASHIYHYEYFDTGPQCAFQLECGMSPNPEIVLEPINYKNQSFNITESLSLGGFPQFAYTIDTFRAWLAQNGNSSFISGVGSALTFVGGAVSGNPLMAGAGLLGVASTVNNAVIASSKADQPRGAQGSSTLTATREKNFYFYNRHIRDDYAQIIDDYFQVYGYQTNRLKVPNFNSRPSWNYVRTKDATIVGHVPFEDIEKIKNVFNTGVTFWHGDYVGDYTRNNSV